MSWYWYVPNPNTWYRAELITKTFNLMTIRVLLDGEVINGRARRVGEAWIVEAK